MLSYSSLIRVFISIQPTDMRKSFEGLCGCVQQQLGQDPLSGHAFVFFNRRRTMVKLLVWQRGGFCIFAKKLAEGRFMLRAEETSGETDMAELLLILEGIDLSGSRRRKRFDLRQEERKK